jgi:hypothetical protein
MTTNIISGARPDAVGCFAGASGKPVFHPVRYDELERGAAFVGGLLRTFAFPANATLLVVSMVQELAQFAAFEKGLQVLGLFGTNAEASNFDAGRVESLCRQFDVPAVAGVNAATLEGLAMFGHDAGQVFAGRTVWARPDAYAAVRALAGVDARRMALLGPAAAFECAHGGLHYDDREWTVSARGGSLHIASRLPRVDPVADCDTGEAGEVLTSPCTCGLKEGRIAL